MDRPQKAAGSLEHLDEDSLVYSASVVSTSEPKKSPRTQKKRGEMAFQIDPH